MEKTIANLVTAIEQRDLALPQFQREYRWPVDNVEELLRSIGQGFPIGTLILLNQADGSKLNIERDDEVCMAAPEPGLACHAVLNQHLPWLVGCERHKDASPRWSSDQRG